MAHTPGPWKLEIDVAKPGETYEDGTLRNTWLWVWNEAHDKVIFHSVDADPEFKPNIMLATAAPELLEACELALSRLSQYDCQAMQTIEKLRAAIAKAEGPYQFPATAEIDCQDCAGYGYTDTLISLSPDGDQNLARECCKKCGGLGFIEVEIIKEESTEEE